jgi:hypothetical protein
MMRSIVLRSARLAFVATLAGLCGACGGLGSFEPPSLSNVISFGAPEAPAAVGPEGPLEVDCPQIEVQDGTAAVRVGGQTNDSVRYQFDIGNTARECHIQGGQFGIKVGVAGHLLIGPAGAPGAYSAQLRIVIRRDSDQKPEVSKTYKIDANTGTSNQALFQLVSEPIMLPYTHKEADQDYTILVGFDNGNGHVAEAKKPRPKKHPN